MSQGIDMRKFVFSAFIGAVAFLNGCSSTVAYVPNPVPADKAVPNLEMTLSRYCVPKPMKVDHGDGFSKVIWNSSATGTRMLVYAEIADIKILEYPAAFQVVTYGRDGKELERFEAKSVGDAKKIADAIQSVRQPN
jgi:hypothetical protein